MNFRRLLTSSLIPTLLIAPALAPQRAAAEQAPEQIVALIDRSVVMSGDIDFFAVEEAIFVPELRGVPRESLRQRYISEAIYDRLLYFWAMTVLEEPPAEFIEGRVKNAYERFRLAVGGERNLEEFFRSENVDPQKFRNWVREQAKQTFMAREALLAFTDLGSATPDPGDIDKARRILFAHILVQPRGTSDEAVAVARERILRVRRDIEAGLSFRDAAMLFSDDRFSAPQGGELGWFEPGQLDETLWNAAITARPGQTSDIVRTRAGFHIVYVLNYETPENIRYFQLIREAQARKLREILETSEIRVADGYTLEPFELEEDVTETDRWRLLDPEDAADGEITPNDGQ